MLALDIILLELSFLALGQASALRPRSPQSPGKFSPFGLLAEALSNLNGRDPIEVVKSVTKPAKVVSIVNMEPKLRSNAKRIDVRYGPYLLVGKDEPRPKSAGQSLDPNGQSFLDLITDGLCTNCTILSGKNKVTFEDGSEAGPVQGVYIHHFVSRDITKPPSEPVSGCGPGRSPNGALVGNTAGFIIKGDDVEAGPILFTTQDGKYDSGYFMSSRLALINQVDLVNYNKASKTVYMHFEIEYVDGHVGSDASAMLMTAGGCNMSSQSSGGHEHGNRHGIKLDPNGIAITESQAYPVKNDTKIVSAVGHMHDGGSKMILLINGKEECVSSAIYGKGGHNNEETIVNMSACPPGIPLNKGDNIVVKAVYDLASHPLRKGGEHDSTGMTDVMGLFYVTFAA